MLIYINNQKPNNNEFSFNLELDGSYVSIKTDETDIHVETESFFYIIDAIIAKPTHAKLKESLNKVNQVDYNLFRSLCNDNFFVVAIDKNRSVFIVCVM